MDINKLKAKIVENGINVEKLAEQINIDRSSLYRKLNNAEKITIGEASRMKDALGMTDEEAINIFFA
jgi:plasmid maintenance system antidote protein VapI